ncbi:IS1 family transposase [Escherichia coli]
MASVSISCPSCSATDGVVRVMTPTCFCRYAPPRQ